ncbi:MAG: beta-lactamase family protein [Alphaproteobacteria bacterium]|nr:beta-lactamase family protein [Alphaproteobacteria bacterium]
MPTFQTPFAIVAIALSLAIPARATNIDLQRCVVGEANRMAFSGVIAASQHGRPLAFAALGHRNGKQDAAIDDRTRFNLGSVSKVFTAVAVGQLIDAGKLRLDDQIGSYVKGLAPGTAAVSIRQLLTHTSGLGDFFRPENLPALLKARSASDLLPLLVQERPAFTPGSRFSYSNSGFALLGILIERISGLSYDDYLARNVFAPAHMIATNSAPDPLATLAVEMTALSLEAHGAAANSERTSPSKGSGEASTTGVTGDAAIERLHPAPGWDELRGSAAGGFFSTADDMQHFGEALLDRRLVSRETLAELTKAQILASPETQSHPARYHGLGFGVGTEHGEPWFGHNGGTPGANAEFVVFPRQRLILTILANRDPPMATKMRSYLTDLVFAPSLQKRCGS